MDNGGTCHRAGIPVRFHFPICEDRVVVIKAVCVISCLRIDDISSFFTFQHKVLEYIYIYLVKKESLDLKPHCGLNVVLEIKCQIKQVYIKTI